MLVAASVLGGCFFGHGKSIDHEALVRPQAEDGYVIEFRETAWPTGNAHMPFDFTVYENDSIYELKVPNLEGVFEAKDLEIFKCGQRLFYTQGTVRLSKEQMVVSLAVESVRGTAHEPPIGSFRLVHANEQQRRCEDRKR